MWVFVAKFTSKTAQKLHKLYKQAKRGSEEPHHADSPSPTTTGHAPSLQGDATFWWNLKQSGDGDMTTRHAGCPVLVGTKWGETSCTVSETIAHHSTLYCLF